MRFYASLIVASALLLPAAAEARPDTAVIESAFSPDRNAEELVVRTLDDPAKRHFFRHRPRARGQGGIKVKTAFFFGNHSLSHAQNKSPF